MQARNASTFAPTVGNEKCAWNATETKLGAVVIVLLGIIVVVACAR